MAGDRGVAGALLLCLGVYYLGLAHRQQRMARYPSIFLVWFALVYLLCLLLHPPPGSPAGTKRRAVYLAISVLQGCGMTLASSCVLNQPRVDKVWSGFGHVCMGGMSGTALAFYLLAMSDGGLVQSAGGRAAVAVVCAVCMAAILAYLPGRAFSACSAILGAYVLVLGVDCFAQTGYMDHLAAFTGCRLGVEYRAGRLAMVLQAVALVLAVLSAAWQRWCALLRFRNMLAG